MPRNEARSDSRRASGIWAKRYLRPIDWLSGRPWASRRFAWLSRKRRILGATLRENRNVRVLGWRSRYNGQDWATYPANVASHVHATVWE